MTETTGGSVQTKTLGKGNKMTMIEDVTEETTIKGIGVANIAGETRDWEMKKIPTMSAEEKSRR